MSLWELWQEWAAGNSTVDLELWGVSMLWWGRIGKILQLLGALTVLAEIVGPERMQRTAASLREATPFTGMVERVRRRWRPVWEWIGARSQGASERSRTAAELARTFGSAAFYLLVARVVAAVLLVVAAVLFGAWAWALLLVAVLGGLALLLLAALLSGLGWLVAVAVIRPFAALLSVAAIEAWLKVVAIALVLVGVHFDLLAT